jgi:hypothetical protein
VRSRAGALLGLVVLLLETAQADPGGADSSLTEGGSRLLAGLTVVLFPLFLPKFLGDATLLKDYVRSEEFRELRARVGDRCAVDGIFDRARELSWGNSYEALLISALATFDHRRFGVRLPLLGALLWFPLTSEFAEDYQARVSALPRNLYEDSPPGEEGDRDKLQHFFGSAFLAYLVESLDAADRVGEFVEWGEERFIVGGVSDDRDRRANREGEQFALHLLVDGAARPSTFLRGSTAQAAPEPDLPCGRWAVGRHASLNREER